MEEKIDPVFRRLIALQTENGFPSILKDGSVIPLYIKDANTIETVISAEQYECIIYTEDAKTLHASGVIINTVLPGFITAFATLNQIVALSFMNEVTYIEAPRVDSMHVKST